MGLTLFSCASLNETGQAHTGTTASGDCAVAPVYVAGGRKYAALKSAKGFRQSGLATVYTGIEQEQTAGCEEFDVNGFTAAHRTLPLPSWVKLTNLDNRQAVVVKVNDRGPSNGKAVIAVTPAVATMLGAKHRFRVKLEALVSRQQRMTDNTSDPSEKAEYLQEVKTSTPATTSASGDNYFIVLGTYESRDEALDKFARVSSIGLPNPAIETRKVKGRLLHMVRLGPYSSQDKIDRIKDRLINDGIISFKIIQD